MIQSFIRCCLALLLAGIASFSLTATAADAKRPNILVIMGDDIGAWNLSTYH